MSVVYACLFPFSPSSDEKMGNSLNYWGLSCLVSPVLDMSIMPAGSIKFSVINNLLLNFFT